MNGATETVVLKSGIEMPRALVLVTYRALRRLMETEPLTLFDAVQMARTGQSRASSAARLDAEGITQGGQMHDGIRDIILSAALGDGLDLQLTSPVA